MPNSLITFFAQAWVLSSAIALFCAWCVWLLFRFFWLYVGERKNEKLLGLERIKQHQDSYVTDLPESTRPAQWKMYCKKLLQALWSSLWAYKERSRLSIQLPDTLDALSNAMRAGYSFPQALEFVERESLMPTKHLLNQAVKEMRHNFSMEEVLLNLQNKAKNRDIEFAIQALLMQLSIGGNVSDMMQQQAAIIRERLSLERDMRAATAQGRMSGLIVALLWPISLSLFYLVSPNYISVMFDTGIGQSLLLLAIVLEIIGFGIIWKITNVKI